jgi:high-affinity iron transporter
MVNNESTFSNQEAALSATAGPARSSLPMLLRNWVVFPITLLILGILVWQGITAGGNPPDPGDPISRHLNHLSVMINAGILVFREGLEAILVLAALTASLSRTDRNYLKPVSIGSGLALLATAVTYYVAVGVLADLNANNSISMLNIQAGTGLLAVVVLMVIMNWFFHKVYWTGWITHHNRRGRKLTASPTLEKSAMFWGLVTIGFTSTYREGFEVVIMLQSWRLLAGQGVVLAGAGIGLALTLLVAVLTFSSHYRLPYRKMLILTGVMMGVVLNVMVGENIQEAQQAGWLATHNLPWNFPGWIENWFATFPNWEGLICQFLALLFVAGSYFVSQYIKVWRPVRMAQRAE